MDELNNLLQAEPVEIISSLDNYQQDIIKTFLKNNSNDYLDSADKWLNASTSNTAKFGGENKSKIYRDKVLEELEKFLCGNEQYDEERKKISEHTDKSREYIVGVLSTSIGSSLGVAGAFIAPVVVLLLLSIGKMALNAWCEMRKELK